MQRSVKAFVLVTMSLFLAVVGCNGGGGGGGGGPECVPVHDFVGGQVDLDVTIFHSVDLSEECDATPEQETFLLDLLNWAATAFNPAGGGGLGLLKTLEVPGYPDLEGGATANMVIEIKIPLVDQIDIDVPMICDEDEILTDGEIFIEETIDELLFGIYQVTCGMTAWASGTITPNSDNTAHAIIQLRELTISGDDCPVDLPSNPGCTMTVDVRATVE